MPTNGLRYLRRVAALLAAGGVLAAGLLFALRAELPDTFVLEQGQPLAVESMPFLQAAPAVPAGSAAPAGVTAADKSANVTLTLLGLPVKTVRTVQQQRRTVQLGGTPMMDPAGLTERSHAEYVACDDLKQMIRENLVAERIAIESYRELIRSAQ